MLAIAYARHLHANVAGCTYDPDGVTGNVVIDHMPTSPDLAVAITPSGGIGWTGHGSIGVDEPTTQFRVRGDRFDSRSAFDLANDIYHALVGMHAVTLDPGGDAEVYVTRTLALQTAPASIGRDANDRPEFVFNLATRIRALSAHRT